MPDPAVMPVAPYNLTSEHIYHFGKPNAYPGALCYQGATARAIELVAQQTGYVIVNVTLGLDLFLVRKDLWHWRVPALEELQIEQCMNQPMSPEMATNLLDYAAYARASGSPLSRLCKANHAAVAELRRQGMEGLCKSKCFKHMAEPIPESPACRKVRELHPTKRDSHAFLR